jgi:hypothetical protein
MDTLIIRAIKSALGSKIHHFEIRLDEVLVDDSDVYSATFSFEPKPIEHPEVKLVNVEKHSFQFDVDKDDDSVSMIWGEDDQMEVSAANIYASLYWCQITEPA